MADLTYGRDVSRHRPKPGNAGTNTDGDSNSAPDTGKWCVAHGAKNRKWGRGGRASGLFSGLMNWGAELNYRCTKKEATRAQVRGVALKEARDISRRRILNQIRIRGKLKFALKGDAKKFANER